MLLFKPELKLLFKLLFINGVNPLIAPIGGVMTWAGLLGLDLSWFMDGVGPALGDLGDSKLSTSMFIAPDVSAQVAPSFVEGLLLVLVVGWCCCWFAGAIGCSNPTGDGWIPVERHMVLDVKIGLPFNIRNKTAYKICRQPEEIELYFIKYIHANDYYNSIL